MDKSRFLSRIPFLSDATPELRREVSEAVVPTHLEQGTVYFQEGDFLSQFAIVYSGRIRVFKLAESGRAITLYHVHPGEACLLNMSCLLADARCPASAEAEIATDVLVFPAPAFRDWVAKYESLRHYIFHLYTTRLTGVLQLVEEITFRRMDQRLAGHLDSLFSSQTGSRGSIEVTHAQIAEELGSAREVISRLLKEFEHLGAVRLARGRIHLESRSLLRTLASSEPPMV